MINKIIEKYNKKLKTEEQFLNTYKTTPQSMIIGNTSESEINLGIMRYKEIVQDLEELKKENIPTSKENTFIFNGEEYQGELGLFQLIYDLSEYGLFELNQDDFEEKGITIVP